MIDFKLVIYSQHLLCVIFHTENLKAEAPKKLEEPRRHKHTKHCFLSQIACSPQHVIHFCHFSRKEPKSESTKKNFKSPDGTIIQKIAFIFTDCVFNSQDLFGFQRCWSCDGVGIDFSNIPSFVDMLMFIGCCGVVMIDSSIPTCALRLAD